MGLTYRVQLIPKSRKQRPGYAMTAKSITTHNTANPNADAAAHAKWQCGNDLSSSEHIYVDDKEAVLIMPLNEQAWHTGTRAGNTTSIGIEVCEFSDRARQDATDRNAQQLIADMLTGNAPAAFRAAYLKVSDVRTHQSWMQYGTSGKYCPRMLLPWWGSFVAGIGHLVAGNAPLPPVRDAENTKPFLHKGDSGPQVRVLQMALNTHGASLKVNGDFGPLTDTAVREFQTRKGLKIDGLVGEQTWGALAKTPVKKEEPMNEPTPYRYVVGWAESLEARRLVEVAAAERNARCVVDGPLFAFMDSLPDDVKEIEAIIGSTPGLHRLHGMPVEKGRHTYMGVATTPVEWLGSPSLPDLSGIRAHAQSIVDMTT